MAQQHKTPTVLLPPVSLRTAILLMFVAGAWIWLNTTSSETGHQHYAVSNANTLVMKHESYFAYGYPFTFANSYKPYIWQVGTSEIAFGKAFLNAFFGASILWVFAWWFSTKKSRSGVASDQPEPKTIKNQYSFFPPIRLSSAIMLMFAAGGWIWLNTYPYKATHYPADEVWMSVYPGPTSGFGFGIPFTVTTSRTPDIADARSSRGIDYFSAATDIFLGLAILWSLAWLFTIIWPNKVTRVRRPENVPKPHEH